MSPRALELIDLVARWTHVIAGIMWVGNSLLFNWLDRNLRPASRPDTGAQGEIWLLHSGGFYFVEKTMLGGRPLPRPMHWFKWQAYTTWISGAVLLVTVYYAGGRILLIDPALFPLRPGEAIALGAGTVVGGLLLYELCWRFLAPRASWLAVALSLTAFLGVVYALTHLMSGRAAFLHVGAMLGTIMAGNVANVIMPSQRALEAAVEAGRPPDPAIANAAKTRSIHNNYLTFPVIVLMLSSHFPTVYSHPRSWLLLLLLSAAGAAVRHILNIRFGWRPWVPALATTIAVSIGAVYLLAGPRRRAESSTNDLTLPVRVSFAEARRVIDRRCAACHSSEPSDLTFGPAPGGVSFDTPEVIRALAPRIRERAVVARSMPPGNTTRMTDYERALLGRWTEACERASGLAC